MANEYVFLPGDTDQRAEPDPTGERDRRLYSAGYQNGQRLAHVPSCLAKNEHDEATSREDPFFVDLGVLHYTAGFRDGFAGRVPARELRLADIEL